jgi:hypothetical protein
VLLVEAADMGPPPHEPPTCRCDECDLVMDFDDMPDSYFAFLSTQRKLVEPDRINGAMRELGHGADADTGRGRVRSRASQPNLTPGSKPSVPSLPSIQRTSTQPVHPSIQPGAAPSGRHKMPSIPPGRPQLGSNPPTGPGTSSSRPGMFAGGGLAPPPGQGYYAQQALGPAAAPPRSNTLVFILIAILLAAIGVLAYLVVTK